MQAEPVNTRLLDALKNVLPWVVTQEVACNGLKCREAVCMSCDSDSEANAEKAAQAYAVANQAIAAAEAQEPDCDGSYDNWPEDRINVIGQNGNTGEHYPEHHSKQAQTYACGIQAGSG